MIEVRRLNTDYTIEDWYREKGLIDFNPPYQRRGGLWNSGVKAKLINSVLNSYDIPKLYVADFSLWNTKYNEKNLPYALIDGKQRMSTLFEFMNDELLLDETSIHTDDSSISLPGLSYSRLVNEYSHLSRKFDNFKLDVMSVVFDDLEQVMELFIRLNSGTDISGAERRNAMAGPVPGVVRELSLHEFLHNYCSFQTQRGQDLNAVTKMLMFEANSGYTGYKKNELDSFVLSYKDRPREDVEALADMASDNMAEMCKVFSVGDPLLARPSQIMVYYKLVKEIGTMDPSVLRQRIGDFEAERRIVRKESSERATGSTVPISNPALLDYSIALRSPDDRLKLRKMYEIIKHYVVG